MKERMSRVYSSVPNSDAYVHTILSSLERAIQVGTRLSRLQHTRSINNI